MTVSDEFLEGKHKGTPFHDALMGRVDDVGVVGRLDEIAAIKDAPDAIISAYMEGHADGWDDRARHGGE